MKDVKLTDIYKTKLGKAFFDFILTYSRNRTEIDAWGFYSDVNIRVHGHYNDFLAMLKLLQTLGYGKYIVGRKGGTTRFVWDQPMLDVARIATAQVGAPATTVTTKEHVFSVRPDWNISIEVPLNLTQKEADRLGDFVKTLAY